MAQRDDLQSMLELAHALTIKLEQMAAARAASHSNLDTDRLTQLKEAFTCTICQDFYDNPYTLECGHAFCCTCLNNWFQVQLTCPTCRKEMVQRPIQTYSMQQAVQAVQVLLFDERSSAEDSQASQRQFEELLSRAFPPLSRHRHVIDVEDDVNRCAACGWELDEDGVCVQCGAVYRGAAENIPTIEDDDEEEQGEDDDDLEGFVVPDEEATDATLSDGSAEKEGSDFEPEEYSGDEEQEEEDENGSSGSSSDDDEDDDDVPLLQRRRSTRLNENTNNGASTSKGKSRAQKDGNKRNRDDEDQESEEDEEDTVPRRKRRKRNKAIILTDDDEEETAGKKKSVVILDSDEDKENNSEDVGVASSSRAESSAPKKPKKKSSKRQKKKKSRHSHQ